MTDVRRPRCLSVSTPSPAMLCERAGRAPLALAALFAGLIAGPAAAQNQQGDQPLPPPTRPSMPGAPAGGLASSNGAQPAPARDPLKQGAARQPDKSKVTVSEQMTVDISVKDENITAVLEMLAVQSRKNIIASKSVTGKVSADLFGVTFYEALDAILHVNGFGYMERGNFLYVYTAQEIETIQKTLKLRAAKVIRLNYLTAPDAAEFVKPMLSTGGEIKTNNKTEAFAIGENGPTGKDDFALGATLVVIDYEENIGAIEKLLAELDTKPTQVLVEATVLSTQVKEDNALGVDFTIIGGFNFGDFASAALGGPFGIINAARSQTTNVGSGTVVHNDAGGTGEPGGFKIGVVGDNVAVFIRMLDQVADTTVLANPKILTLNRQPSRVLVGQRVGYLSSTATETSTTQTVQFLDTGVQLYFRPFVNAAKTEVRMELKPQFSRATPTRVPGQNGAQVVIPNEDTQEIVTNVTVPDGMTVVLGGLFRENITSERKQVPFVGDLPIIGAAFRGQTNSTDRTELIFLVTPTIINDSVLVTQGDRAVDMIERVRAGTRQGLLPWTRERMTAALNMEAEQLARQGKTSEALWGVQRSLALNPLQPDALRMRERLTGEAEIWPSRSVFEEIVHKDINERIMQLPTPKGGEPTLTPWNAVKVPQRPAHPEKALPQKTANPDLGRAPAPAMPTEATESAAATPQATEPADAAYANSTATAAASPSADATGTPALATAAATEATSTGTVQSPDLSASPFTSGTQHGAEAHTLATTHPTIADELNPYAPVAAADPAAANNTTAATDPSTTTGSNNMAAAMTIAPTSGTQSAAGSDPAAPKFVPGTPLGEQATAAAGANATDANTTIEPKPTAPAPAKKSAWAFLRSFFRPSFTPAQPADQGVTADAQPH